MRAAQPEPASVSMTSFAVYLSSTGAGRIACASAIAERYGAAYSPMTDHYAGFVAAARRGRESGADEFELRKAARRASVRRAPVFELIDPYLRLLAKVPGTHLPTRRAVWRTPDLDIVVAPEFAIQQRNGTRVVVKLYLRTDELARDGADAMLYMMGEHMSTVCPGGTPAIFDVRREKIYRPRQRRAEFPVWLRAEAGTLAQLWRAVA